MPRLSILCALAIATAAATTAWADPDADGCKDFYVSRMSGYYIRFCDMKDFDSYKFMEGTDHETVVEGKIAHNQYAQPDDATPNSGLKVQKNYINALTADGWTILDTPEGGVTARQTKNGKERWVELTGNGGTIYELFLAEKAGMAQSVITADDMTTALNRDGRISLQINFDTARSTIRPDSQPIIQQIVTMMKANPALKLSVEGHTDNVGTPESNKTLSLARAQAVASAVASAGIAASRMTPAGYGQERPVADNSTEQGRAQNRRVVLVKQ